MRTPNTIGWAVGVVATELMLSIFKSLFAFEFVVLEVIHANVGVAVWASVTAWH